MKKIVLAALFICLGFAASAQTFTFYGEGTMPTGRYGKSVTDIRDATGEFNVHCAITDSSSNLGAAYNGWGAGFQIAYPMANKGIELVFDAGFRMTWLNSEIRHSFNYFAAKNGTEGITSAPHYYNIPLMVGPRFTVEPFAGFGLYANLLLGFDIRIISDAIYTPDYAVDYYSTGTLALRAAAGLLLFDHLRLEVNWSWMGDDTVEGVVYENGVYRPKKAFGNLETMQLGGRIGWTF